MEYDFDKILHEAKTGQYKLLGNGSCRIVFDLGDGSVAKIAKDIRGIDQNQNEYAIFHARKSDLFAEVTAVSSDNRMLIMAKADKIKNMKTVYAYYKVQNISSLLKHGSFSQDVNTYKLSKGDLVRPSSWGLIGGIPMLIDFGLTHGIFIKYYKNNLFNLRRFTQIKYM